MRSSSSTNIGISVCRVVATIMIIICHFGTAYGFSAIGQFFQAGVQIFLLISGVLYGRKKVNNIKVWLINRWKRVCVPCYIHTFVLAIICLFVGARFSIVGLLEILFNIEGIHHIFTGVKNTWILPGTAHFWFITCILICYIIVIVLKYHNLDALLYRNKSKILLSLFIVSILSGLAGVRIDYFFIFMIGYLYADDISTPISNKRIYLSVLLFIIAIALRLSAKFYCDTHGDNNLYLYVIIPISYNAIAFAVYSFIMKIHNVTEKSTYTISNTAVNGIVFLDAISFYVFITHYMLIDGPIATTHSTANILLNVLITVCLIIVTSLLLKIISEIVLKRIQKA